jgi:hypothetical protein
MKFKIGDKITSVIQPAFLGQITAISQYKNMKTYTVSHFIGDEPRVTTMYEFEITDIEKEPLGFKKNGKT